LSEKQSPLRAAKKDQNHPQTVSMSAMGKTMLKVLFTAITLFSLQTANAETFEEFFEQLDLPLGAYTVIGPASYGVVPCDLLLAMYESRPKETMGAYFAWWQGYISGWNEALHIFGKPTIDTTLMSETAQAGFLESFCDQHPNLSTMKAADLLRLELEARTAKRDKDKATTSKDRFGK
jgi:hypothetical protein